MPTFYLHIGPFPGSCLADRRRSTSAARPARPGPGNTKTDSNSRPSSHIHTQAHRHTRANLYFCAHLLARRQWQHALNPPTPTTSGNGSTPPTTPTPTTGGSGGSTLTLAQTLAEYELIKALAPNRIIFHAATPIQLCKVEDGLQIYYISRKGKTRLGPYVPSFAELAAKYPDGDEASIYFGFNPLTGKRVKIDYLPSRKTNSRRHLLRR